MTNNIFGKVQSAKEELVLRGLNFHSSTTIKEGFKICKLFMNLNTACFIKHYRNPVSNALYLDRVYEMGDI